MDCVAENRNDDVAQAGAQIGPTGKSIPIFGNNVKLKNSENQKYFAFPEAKSVAHLSPSRPGKRGVGHRHERGTGSGGRGSAFDEGC
jgi:hypothetical protein